MPSLKKSCFAKPFSHIYVERSVRTHPRTQRLLRQLQGGTVVEIDSYRHVFNRGKQNFALQKKSPKLILAKKQAPHVYPFSHNCQQAQFENAVYVTPALGCRFDCDFCFLHGMYSSANLVFFVNIEDTFEELAQMIAQANRPLLVSISYETDLLALETLCGTLSDWIAFCRLHPMMFMECRSRSGLFNKIESIPPADNFVLSWSLNPKEVIDLYEHGAPAFESRLSAARSAVNKGWHVRLCFDPVIPIPDWEAIYPRFFETVFDTIPSSQLYDVTVGSFRMGRDFFKRIRRRRPWCDLYFQDSNIDPEAFNRVIMGSLKKFVAEEKLIQWKSQS